jgi:hypothetical protein
MFATDKHTSLSQSFVNYGRKKFYNIVTRSFLDTDESRHFSEEFHSGNGNSAENGEAVR